MDRVKFLKSAFFIVFLALASTNCYSYFVPVPVKLRPPPPSVPHSYFVPVPLKPRPPPPSVPHSYFVPVPVKPRPPPLSGPLCLSQFALVNHACARVLLEPLNPPSPQESLATTSSAPPPLSPPSSPLPTSSAPPPLSPPSSPLPSSPSLPSPHNGTRHGHSSPLPSSPSPPSPHNGTRHRHRHRHERAERQGHPESLDEEQCCRWMQVVDAECVCSLLVHLPSILLRLTHNYTVVLSESCHITYQCEGGWKV